MGVNFTAERDQSARTETIASQHREAKMSDSQAKVKLFHNADDNSN